MKRLFRDRQSKMVAGVASGLAQYLEIDPVLVRVGFVLGAFANGIGILGYIILWVLVPQRPYAFDVYPEAESAADATPPPSRSSTLTAATVFGAILICVGMFALLDNFLPWVDFSELWPLVLVAMGIALIVRNARSAEAVAPAPAEPAATEPEAPQSYSSPLQ